MSNTDFRQMLDEVKGIDAVTISTPDHAHYPAAMHALGHGKHVTPAAPAPAVVPEQITVPVDKANAAAGWAPDAERELGKIPFFVRGKARRNTELYARDMGLPIITLETLYDAKAHFSR